MNKKSIIISIIAICAGGVLGFLFRAKFLHSVTEYTQLPKTNWFLVAAFLLLLGLFIAMGYLIDRRINR